MATVTRHPAFVALVLAMLAPACASRSGSVPRPFPGAPLPPQPTAGAPDPATISPGEPGIRSEPPADASVPSPPGATPAPVPLPTLVSTALSLRGAPYLDGGTTPDGFDCSGFVQWVFGRHGTRLPREVRDQFRTGRAVDQRELRAGDLVFFETVSRGASHVGIVVDSETFVHAPSSRGVVRVERLSALYWSQRFVGARRMLEGEPFAATN